MGIWATGPVAARVKIRGLRSFGQAFKAPYFCAVLRPLAPQSWLGQEVSVRGALALTVWTTKELHLLNLSDRERKFLAALWREAAPPEIISEPSAMENAPKKYVPENRPVLFQKTGAKP